MVPVNSVKPISSASGAQQTTYSFNGYSDSAKVSTISRFISRVVSVIYRNSPSAAELVFDNFRDARLTAMHEETSASWGRTQSGAQEEISDYQPLCT